VTKLIEEVQKVKIKSTKLVTVLASFWTFPFRISIANSTNYTLFFDDFLSSSDIILEQFIAFRTLIYFYITCYNSSRISQERHYVSTKTEIKFRGFQSASELYRLSDCHWSVNFSANFCG
jgi:hypothetical protein